MLLNIKLKTAQKISKYSKNTVEIIFCKSNAEFDKLLKSNNIHISDLHFF